MIMESSEIVSLLRQEMSSYGCLLALFDEQQGLIPKVAGYMPMRSVLTPFMELLTELLQLVDCVGRHDRSCVDLKRNDQNIGK